jgi:hypothetical protein
MRGANVYQATLIGHGNRENDFLSQALL